ncbi:MAG: hypothetical protein J6Z35_02025 [Lachnospiraceae bacterium]|nr:hypothetical protein [Lachnospiraceae bacterium]
MKKMTKSSSRKFGGLRAVMLPVFLILAICLIGIKVEAWSGKGTAEEPYLIEKVADLVTLQIYVNGGYSCRDKYFLLTTNLDLSEVCGEISEAGCLSVIRTILSKALFPVN